MISASHFRDESKRNRYQYFNLKKLSFSGQYSIEIIEVFVSEKFRMKNTVRKMSIDA